jgi:hypothetical protein
MSEKQEKQKPSYHAIIPANVRYDNDLSPNTKLLYSEITALSNKEGYCFASNLYFSKLYNTTVRSIINWINLLVDKGYITKEIIYKENSSEIIERRLYINGKIIKKMAKTVKNNFTGGSENNFTGGSENNFTHNNTRNIIIQDKNRKEIKNKEKENQIKEIYKNQNQKTSIPLNYYPSEKTLLELQYKIKFLNNFENRKYIIYLDEQISNFKLYYKQRTDKKYVNWDDGFRVWIRNQIGYIIEKLPKDKIDEFIKLKDNHDRNKNIDIKKIKNEIIETIKENEISEKQIGWTINEIEMLNNLVYLQTIHSQIKLLISSMVHKSITKPNNDDKNENKLKTGT